MLIVGSASARLNGFSLNRIESDLDIMISRSDFNLWIERNEIDLEDIQVVGNNPYWEHRVYDLGNKKLEIEITKDGNSTELLLDIFKDKQYIDLETLCTLKMSHRFLKDSPHFHKTMKDIHTLRKAGIKAVPKHLKEFYDLRRKETYWYKHPKLNTTKDSFFDEADVHYIYDHDSIHRAVAKGPTPAYELYKPEDEEVMCSKELFNSLPYEIRLNGVYEEACVLALERSIIPFKTQKDIAFEKALEKVCTSITSGWFRNFAWENYDAVKNIERTFLDDFNRAMDRGEILDFKK